MKKITYSKLGDYYYPNLQANEQPYLSKWGRAKLKYLKQNEQGLYTSLLLKNQLNEYLLDIDLEANLMYDHLIKQLIIQHNQMLWVKEMNMISKIAEEIVLNKYIKSLRFFFNYSLFFIFFNNSGISV